MNLFARYAKLKKQVGGNREKQRFEFTMGSDVLMKNHITPPEKHIRRMLAQVHFALQLNKRRSGAFDTQVCAALDVLEQGMEKDGVLTCRVCEEAEKCLLPMEQAAKEYEVLYAAHSHIDMNWQWGMYETVSLTLSTFRTMLNLMNEYPGFTFSQSQASVYQIVEQYDKDMMEEIKARIREGRWEVTASAWVETDKNMPGTESLIRHIRYTRDYLRDVWGVDPDSVKVDFSPDTFGHGPFVPEINTFGNVPYYYHCRGLQDDLTLYRYRAPSGSEVLMYKEPYWYNSGINPDNGTGVFELEKRCAGLKTALVVYGVGNHGGGPTRRDLDQLTEMQQWPIFPRLRFGTFHEFFAIAESVREKLPVVEHELNAIFTGCYTSQSRIKHANRRAEGALLDAEKMSALSHFTLGTKFERDGYAPAWQKVLFSHFHDILTGTCVPESRDHALGLMQESLAFAQTQQSKAYEKLTQHIDTSMFPYEEGDFNRSEGAGSGYGSAHYAFVPNPERGKGKTRIYTVFNPTSQPCQAAVECPLWDYAGDLDQTEMVDHEGRTVPHQFLNQEPEWYWDHDLIRFVFRADVPAMGWRTYALREKEIEDYPTHLLLQERTEEPKGPVVLENEYLRAVFGDGQIHSLVNKKTGEEMLRAPGGLCLVHAENSGSGAWGIGRYAALEPVTDTVHVKVQRGKVQDRVIFEQKVLDSTVEMAVTLGKGDPHLGIALNIHWHEWGKHQHFVPLLTFRLPLKKGSDQLLTDVPGGAICRSARDMDVPALSFGCAVTEGETVALITDSKYGYRWADQVLSVSLINTTDRPDPYPEVGVHQIRLFLALTDGKAALLKTKAEQLIRPMTAVHTAHHTGCLLPSDSLMQFESGHSVISAVFAAKDDALCVRVYETEGSTDQVTLHAPFAPARAVLTDLDENVLQDAAVTGNKVTFPLGAHRITQVKIYR